MSPEAEAAQILTRVFEALARANGKTLNARSRVDIQRACELLSHAGQEFGELLDELPKVTPGEAANTFVAAAEADPGYQEWRRRRAEADRR